MSQEALLVSLGVGFVAYAVLHSLLAAQGCKAWCARNWPWLMPRYRLLYNALAVLLLAPLAWLLWLWPAELVWQRPTLLRWLGDGAALLALLGFAHSLSSYDLSRFSGTRQWRQAQLDVDSDQLQIGFWHRFVRHPWYSFGLVIIWTRDMNAAQLLLYTLVTLYLVVGSWLEEQKLLSQFGGRYRRYAERVPGLVPRPWRYLSQAEARALLQCQSADGASETDAGR